MRERLLGKVIRQSPRLLQMSKVETIWLPGVLGRLKCGRQ